MSGAGRDVIEKGIEDGVEDKRDEYGERIDVFIFLLSSRRRHRRFGEVALARRGV